MLKNGDDSFEFPIGDSQFFRFAAISAPDNAGDIFAAKYYFESPGTGRPLENKEGVLELIDDQEYWTISRESGSSTVLLTLSWNEDTTTPQNIVANPQSSIRIARWDETLQLWLDEGGVVDVNNRTVTTPVVLDQFGVFTLARGNEDFILPGDVIVYNSISPNTDGKNDFFRIENIQNLANNTVEIYNRWGVQVFETSNYDSNGNVFDGFSNGRLTYRDDERLPTGTYFYVISYDLTENGTTTRIEKAGYLYLSTD